LLTASPAQAVIVNVDGVNNVQGSEVEVFLAAGPYTATLRDGLNDGDPATDYTAWFTTTTGADGWNTGYTIELADGSAIASGGTFSFSASEADAFAATVSLTESFLVPAGQFIGFRVGDCAGCGFDNDGGVSLDVQPVVEQAGTDVPAPAMLPLFLAGLAALVIRRRAAGP
jgi:uncharacterized protein (TIGR03382 family)